MSYPARAEGLVNSTSEESLLNKCLNFATTIKWIPYLDLVAPIEEAALKILKVQADELRWKEGQAPEKLKPPKLNISKEERFAINSWQGDENIIMLLADKSNTTIEMDKVEYSNKLADCSYCEVKKGPTMKTERKLSQILSKNKDLLQQMKYRQLTQHNSKLPHIYGLPKIHKDGIPLRSIISNRSSACYPLSYFVVEIVTPLTSKSLSYVKNSIHFLEKISNATIYSNQIVSRDVVSLFTRVPTDDKLTVERDKWAEDPPLEEFTCISIDNPREMLTYCLETTYFGMRSDIYR